LHIYRGGHLELAADAAHLGAIVEAFLDADTATGVTTGATTTDGS
jgi:hypothetical protein